MKNIRPHIIRENVLPINEKVGSLPNIGHCTNLSQPKEDGEGVKVLGVAIQISGR